MASDIWLRTILIVRKETRCRHIGYSFRLAARVLLYAPSHRQDNTYHGLCYTSRGALAGTRNTCPLVYMNKLCVSDVGSWRDGGGRGAMQQPKPESQSPPLSSPSQTQTETQQNGPPTSGGADIPSPSQPMPPRPGSNQGPGGQGPMPMGPHMAMPAQFRGMMTPYVSKMINISQQSFAIHKILDTILHFSIYYFLHCWFLDQSIEGG